MKKEFIPYEQALALKELGFEEPCFGFYYVNPLNNSYTELKCGMSIFKKTSIEIKKGHILAPLYQQAFRWFREKHNIHSFIIPLIDEVGFVYKYQARVHAKESAVEIIGEFETHEEAELACLEKLIELTFKSE